MIRQESWSDLCVAEEDFSFQNGPNFERGMKTNLLKKEIEMIIVVFGVCGSGKTTIGKKLSLELQIPFYDADDFHPQANIEKMASGIH